MIARIGRILRQDGVTGLLYRSTAFAYRRAIRRLVPVAGYAVRSGVSVPLAGPSFVGSSGMIAVKHSGHIGDVVYSLPAVEAIAKFYGQKVHFFLQEGVLIRREGDQGIAKPALTRDLTQFIKPLIEAQPYIGACSIGGAELASASFVDFDLDLFRKLPVNFRLGHLPLHYMHLLGHFTDYAAPWLEVAPKDRRESAPGKVLIGRSPRNINGKIDYGAINAMGLDTGFVGLPDEFLTMQRHIPGLRHEIVANAYDMLSLIESCAVFIGNSSFNFSLAEGLKKRRLFEMNLNYQSLMPCGNVGYFTSTEQLLSGMEAALREARRASHS